jgi:hypothetical protein
MIYISPEIIMGTPITQNPSFGHVPSYQAPRNARLGLVSF